MKDLTRRSVLRASMGMAAAGVVARPYIANAQANTATIWWAQGFVPQEDDAFHKVVADFEKASGDKIDFSIVPFAPLRQKIISAITSGVVPDLVTVTPNRGGAVAGVAGPPCRRQRRGGDAKGENGSAVLEAAHCYNNVAKKRAYYTVPHASAVRPFHVWGSLVEKAGYKVSDIPKKWDAFIDFFIPIQDKLRDWVCGTPTPPALWSVRSATTPTRHLRNS